MKPINNPFDGADDYNCFGCDPGNPIGLKLRFHLDGETVVADWTPRHDLEGFPGIVHGGIQATLADEIAAWYIMAVLGVAGVTKELKIKYLRPAGIADGPFTLRASAAQSDSESSERPRVVGVKVTMENSAGKLCSETECSYGVFSEAVSRERFAFPGKAALFDEPPG